MKCTRCQSEIKQGEAFCMNCGQKVNWQQPAMQQAPMQQSIMQQAPMQQSIMPQAPMQQSIMPQAPMQQSIMPQASMQQPTYSQNMYGQPVTTNNTESKKKSKAKFVWISIIAIALVIGIIGIVIAVLPKDEEKKGNGTTGTGTAEPGNNPQEEKAEHTIMIYMIGSDLETESKLASMDLAEIMGAKYGEDIKVVVQTGGAKKWWTSGIEDGKVQRFELKPGKLEELDNLGKINMVEPDTLSDFIKFASENYAAEKYTLVLWDHGGGIPIGFGKEENYRDADMSEAELNFALKEANVKFESIVMDACNMCTLEVALAVRDYAKYMVAAESYTVGTGLDYSGWLNYMGENPEAVGFEYGEILVTEYMDSVTGSRNLASMSTITLSKVDAVYTAYADYIESVLKKIEAGDYVAYAQARENCGLYEYTDSVDMITLATKYKTDKSDALITAVINAVGHTESDYLFGHGLAAYSPHTYAYMYSDARESMETLGYDKEVLDCYDAYVSLVLAYYGPDAVNEYAGNWYDEGIVSQYVASGTQSGEYDMPTTVVDGNNVISASDVPWSTLSSIKAGLYMITEDESIVALGQDYYYEFDDDNNVVLDMPKNWVYINDYLAPYMCISYYEDESTDEWMEIGMVYARRNGEQILIIIYFDNENPSGQIGGYMYFDYETLTETDHGHSIFDFQDGDDIEIIHLLVDSDSDDVRYENLIGEHFDGGSLEMKYAPLDLSESKIACTYELEDVYGNKYNTKLFIFE